MDGSDPPDIETGDGNADITCIVPDSWGGWLHTKSNGDRQLRRVGASAVIPCDTKRSMECGPLGLRL